MANLTLPAAGAVPYPSVLTPRPSRLRKPAPGGEDDMFVSFGINWSTDGGAGNCVLLDLSQSASVLPVSQIVAGYIDNSKCNVDVELIFLDTQTSAFVPARSQALVPLVAGATQFHIVAVGAGLGDQTFGVIFNFMPPPVALNEISFATTTSAGGIAITAGPASTQIVPLGTNGVLTAVYVEIYGMTAGAGNGTISIQLQDQAGAHILLSTFIFARSGVNYDNLNVWALTGLAIPFHNGIDISVANGGTVVASGNITVDLTTR